jgi:putative transposase
MTTAFTELRSAQISVQKSCTLTEISRATHYRRANPKGPVHGPWLPRTPPPAALTDTERAAVTDLLTSPTYADLAIPQVWARELDEGRYWCSISTMYRIARAAGQVSERRRLATHPPRVRPELVAHGPSEVWSWDITREGDLVQVLCHPRHFLPICHGLVGCRGRGRGRGEGFPYRRYRA